MWLVESSDEQQSRRFLFSLSGIILSTALLIASLWQIEIASALPGPTFDFPFYLWSVDKWWARDFWYLINVISWVLGVFSTAALMNIHNSREPRQ